MKKNFLIFSALVLGLTPLTVPVKADSAMSGMDMSGAKTAQKPAPASLSVTATINPAAPKSGDNALDLMVMDAAGKPVTGLKLTGSVAMTSMDIGTTHPAFNEAGSGHYKATVNFSMEGPWRVVVRGQGAKVAVLDFEPGSKTPWKSPQIKATLGTSSVASAPAAKTPAANAMAGMDMSGSKDTGKADAAKPDAAKPDAMADMDMTGAGQPEMSGMKTGIADMKTATVPQLQEKGTYTATGKEDWKMQTGFGHNAGMVGMMNQMMVGGSGSEGMKMAPMNMKFGKENYAKPEGDDAGDSMVGMKMDAAPSAATQDAPADGGQAMPGMDMAAPAAGNTPAASAPVQVTATPASAPKAGDNALTISITDAQGKPITGAKITTSVAMTSMDMGTTHPAVTEKGGGEYTTTATFSMAGAWRVKVKVTPPGQKPQTKAFDFSAK